MQRKRTDLFNTDEEYEKVKRKELQENGKDIKAKKALS